MALGGDVVVSGAGHVTALPCDPTPFLRSRKMRKFMGPQDDLATVAACRAAADAGLAFPLGPRAGLFLAVGYLPFEGADMHTLLEGSLDPEGAFDVRRFSTTGLAAVNPLLTFRCLSNMPAFHVSLNLGVEGPYAVLYPTGGEAYAGLEEAAAALADGRADVALWGGVAHQRNALVDHHHARIDSGLPPERRLDAAAVVVLKRAERCAARGGRVRARLAGLELDYAPHDPFEVGHAWRESAGGVALEDDAGAAGPPLALCRALLAPPPGPLGPGLEPGFEPGFEHRLATRTGITARARWELA